MDNQDNFNAYENSKSSRKYSNPKQQFASMRSGSSISTRSGQGSRNITMFSNIPLGSNKNYLKQLSAKSNRKKAKKSTSRLNSSALSVYTEQPSNLMKSYKENVNDVSLNSYTNIPIMKDQFRTINNSILHSRDFENRRLMENNTKTRVKTTSQNSQIDAQKLLDAMISKDTSLALINTNNCKHFLEFMIV